MENDSHPQFFLPQKKNKPQVQIYQSEIVVA